MQYRIVTKSSINLNRIDGKLLIFSDVRFFCTMLKILYFDILVIIHFITSLDNDL